MCLFGVRKYVPDVRHLSHLKMLAGIAVYFRPTPRCRLLEVNKTLEANNIHYFNNYHASV